MTVQDPKDNTKTITMPASIWKAYPGTYYKGINNQHFYYFRPYYPTNRINSEPTEVNNIVIKEISK